MAHLATALSGRSIVRMEIGNAFTVFFGLLFVAVGFYIYFEAGRFTKRAQETTGVVVDLVLSSRYQTPEKFPVVRFRTAGGKEVVFKSREHYNSEVGQTLAISYDPANPENARIGSLSSVRRWAFFFSALCILFGLGVCFIGFGLEFGILKWGYYRRR